MIDAIGAVASVMLPWAAGTLAVRALWYRPGQGAPSLPLALGYGYLAGLLIATAAMRGFSFAGVRWSLPLLAGAVATAGAISAWLAHRSGPPAFAPDGLCTDLASEPRPLRALFWCALALVALRLAGLAVEVSVSPFRAYDAWAHWGTKAIVWHEEGRMVPFVSPAVWIAGGDARVFTDGNPGHPANVPLMLAWSATFLSRWSESLVNAPWVALAIALALAFYAQARLAGASAPLAMTGTWLVMSLPILNLHVALAGAADVVLGSAYAMAAMAMWRWTVTREREMAALAALAATFAVGVKVEGMLWVATLVPGVVVALHRRAGFALAAAFAAASAGYVAFGPDSLPVLGYVLKSKPYNVLPTLRDHLFMFDNWHLGWYAVVAIAAWRWRILLAPRVAPMTFTILAGVALIGVVYFFTNAALGVRNETLVNRMPLHLAPAIAFYALLLVVEGRGRPGVQPSLQATYAADA